MIIDDCIALIGSANINDRSLLGSRDSEVPLTLSSSFFCEECYKTNNNIRTAFQIAIVIEDNELINSYMGEQPWKAGKFCWSLRLSLWSEHLGLRPGQVSWWKMKQSALRIRKLCLHCLNNCWFFSRSEF